MSKLCYLCLTCICICVTVTEDKDTDEVTLNCSLLTFEDCRHTVKWLLIGYNVDKQTERSQTDCFTTVSFPNSHNSNVSRDNIMKCQGTHTNTSKVLFTIIHQPSGEEAGEITSSCWTWMAGYEVWMQISFSFFHNKWKNKNVLTVISHLFSWDKQNNESSQKNWKQHNLSNNHSREGYFTRLLKHSSFCYESSILFWLIIFLYT